ncbi:MAG: HlyD family efflux transporter periplasmic adaptor subunit [Cyanobacteria bacterium P01_D01_bin.156]
MEKLVSQTIQINAQEEFLQSPHPLVWGGGIAALFTLVATIGGCWFIPYSVKVKAAAIVRAQGELRHVQAPQTGLVKTIVVTSGDVVQAGDTVAVLHDIQLQSHIAQAQQELTALRRQWESLEQQQQLMQSQWQANAQSWNREIRIAETELQFTEHQFQQRRADADSDLQVAASQFQLAEQSLNRYRQIADQGAVSQLSVLEREAQLESAHAQLLQAQTANQVDRAMVDQAVEKIAQAKLERQATLDQMSQEQTHLGQQRTVLEGKISQQQALLERLTLERSQLELKAPVSGQIQTTNLRNLNQVVQPGELLLQIAPVDESLVIKAWVPNSNISQVEVGQLVNLRLESCPHPDYGVLKGTVTDILSDATLSAATTNLPLVGVGPESSVAGSYEVTIKPQRLYLENHSQRCNVRVGMQGRADIQVGQETVLQFLLRKARLSIASLGS